jgi:YedE family putative selenium metabolism protein
VNLKEFLAPKARIVLTGLLFGLLGALAVNWGNPPNMGICVACFLRDVAGGLHFHQNSLVQYLRPEIGGMVLGAFTASLAWREWHTQGGSSPILRFFLGAFVMIGVLVFLGCPIRLMLRLAGGDLNGLVALPGMVTGILLGSFFLKRGFSLGTATDKPAVAGLIMPLAAVGLLFLLVAQPAFIAFSETGPGSQHVPWLLGLGLGLLVGFMVQRTGFCSIAAWRDIFLVKDFHLFSGLAAFLVAALLTNYLAGNFSPQGLGYHWGFTQQPIALPMTDPTSYLWTFLSLGLVGLAGTLLNGCPLRSLIRCGEGDLDAAFTVMGYLAGAAVAHNLPIASSPIGLGSWGPVAVVIGFVFCITIGFLMSDMTAKQKETAFVGDGVVYFRDVQSAMKAEKTLQASGYPVKLVAPPPTAGYALWSIPLVLAFYLSHN